MPGERICLYLTELAKPGGAETLREFIAPDNAERVIEQAPAILAQFSSIRGVVGRSAKNPSRIRNWHARDAATDGLTASQEGSTATPAT